MNKFEIKNIKDFILQDTVDNGQCFRWEKLEENKYIGIVKDGVFEITEEIVEKDLSKEEKNSKTIHSNLIVETNLEKDKAMDILNEYFDISFDYSKIKEEYSKVHSSLDQATSFGKGLRILKQDKLEMIISYIISANNNIKRIKKIINTICENYGEEVIFKNNKYYLFPTLEVLKTITEEEFKKMGTGFRAIRLEKTISKLTSEYIENLEKLNDEELYNELLTLDGVGSKVANCIMLFGYNRLDSFPIDVWVKRVMQEEFFEGKETPNNIIEEFSRKLSKRGLAQQYLFYWRRLQ